MALTDYKVSTADIQSNAIQYTISSDRLSGTVLQNKQTFDKLPLIVAQRHNELIDNYIASYLPTGDVGLDYTATEITFITTTLGCTEASITL